MILAGDIGGTNTRLALFDPKSLTPLKNSLHKYPSGQHKSLEAILDLYLAELPARLGVKKLPTLKAAGFGVAGPVRDGKVKTTNLPWSLDAAKLARRLKVRQAALVNDLYATAAGIEVLPKKSLLTLRKGKPPKALSNAAVVAPGTGLGHAGLIAAGPDADHHVICPSEAGHTEFAPTTDLESRLREFIAARSDTQHGFFGRCSYENVVSGMGIRNIYQFLTTAAGFAPSPAVEAADPRDQTRLISESGLARSDATCAQAMDLFTAAFARQAGNFALSVLALGGVYLGGGIPPRILPALKTPQFLNHLSSKGPQAWMAEIPVHVIIDDLCALYGAANSARRV